MGEVARRTVVTTGQCHSGCLTILSAVDLFHVRPTANDRRATVIKLTDKGRSAAQIAPVQRTAWILKRFSPKYRTPINAASSVNSTGCNFQRCMPT